MNDRNSSDNCNEIRSLLPAFLADELAAAESRRVQDHLDGCAACTGFQRFEGAFDGALKRTLNAGAAPASLVVKIHRSLDEEDAGNVVRLKRTMDRPWVRWALAASLLVMILGPGVVGVRTGLISLPVSVAGVTQSAEGTLVCAACMRLGRAVSEQRGCRAHGHHTALQTDNGGLWEFVDNRSTRPLLVDADRIGDRVQVEGLFIDDLRYVRVDSYRYLGRQEAPSQGL